MVKQRQLPKKLPPAPRIDVRVQRSKELVLRTMFELLVERGLGGASVDEVAKRSGVAKTTIYRHWKTRADLVFEACALVSGSAPTPDSGSLEGDLTVLLHGLARQLKTASWSLVLPSVVDASERDPELAAALAQRQRNQAASCIAAIERAKKRGELSAKTDASALAARLIGPLFYRRWFTREALDDAFVKGLIKAVVASTRGGVSS